MNGRNFAVAGGSMAAACLLCVAISAGAQTEAPVYGVLSSGASPEQARSLASLLKVPFKELSLSNGQVFFMDNSTFMATPTLPVVDQRIIKELTAQTENPVPDIPLRFEQFDFPALEKMQVPSSETMLSLVRTAFGQSNLDPQYGTPVVGHTMLTAFYQDEKNGVFSNSLPLDTKVLYEFKTPEGHRMIGPGAQVQLHLGPAGGVTHLSYSARKLERLKSIKVISEAEARRRAARLFPPDAKIQAELVYWCPPPSSPASSLIPWYSLTGTSKITDPQTGRESDLEQLAKVLPASDDPAFLPAVQLEATVRNGSDISATANVTGGQRPYTYEWSGSLPGLAERNDPNVKYTPQYVVPLPALTITRTGPGEAVVSWPKDPGSADVLILESSRDLVRPSWKPVGLPVRTNGVYSVLVKLDPNKPEYYRIRLADEPVERTEMLSVLVTDANGVQVQAMAELKVEIIPIPRPDPSPYHQTVMGTVDWGTESPFDPGLGTGDRAGWTAGMTLGGGGTQRFLWIDDNSWKKDFIDAPGGVNDGQLDNADIVLYIGHGNPVAITFTGGPGPDPLTLFYNQATDSWGDRDQEWLCFLSCSVLKFDDASGNVWARWGPNFNGLHILTGFRTSAGAGTGFPFTFTQNMLGGFFGIFPARSIVNSWFAAAHSRGTGSPAAMGPIGPGGVCDYGDYYWGKGPVGPTIRASQIRGWWYAQ